MKYPSRAMASSSIVGVAGLGSRGRAMGNRLRNAGRRVLGFDDDVRAAASSGVRTAGSSTRLAQECEVELVSCDGEQAEQLIQELLDFDGITSLTTIVLCGTLEPRRVRRLAEASAAKGIALVDAPLDGGDEAILAGQATIFAGGSQPAVDGCRALLETLGDVVYVGDAGSGQMARTVNDVLRWANVLAIRDAFSLVQAAGGEPSPIRNAVLQASGANRVLEEWGRLSVSSASQDIEAALLLAQATSASVPFVEGLKEPLERLDPDEMAGLFNLGIVDLTARGGDLPGQADDPWEIDDAAPAPGIASFGEPAVDADALGFGEPSADADRAGFGELLVEVEEGGLEPPEDGEPFGVAETAAAESSQAEADPAEFGGPALEDEIAGFGEAPAEADDFNLRAPAIVSEGFGASEDEPGQVDALESSEGADPLS